MPNYQNGKIYCIRSHQTDKVYVGSTTVLLSARMAKHRWACKTNYKNPMSQHIIKYGDAYIELIKLYPCSCRSELEREEGKYIREMNCVNKVIAGRTIAEYYEDNKEKMCAKVECPHCKLIVGHTYLKRHQKYYCHPQKRENECNQTI